MRIAATAAVLILCPAFADDAFAARTGKKQLWGAIAYNNGTGAYGYAVDMKSKRDAETQAHRQCGSDCDRIKSFRDACGAVAANARHAFIETGASRAIAESKAGKKCGGDCAIAAWACTTEK
jgi:Domain of unknown function (DUF4189)